jgi:hypothetical protein
LGISKRSLEKKIHFNVILIERSIIYYGEEGGGLLAIPSHVTIMNSKQVHDPKLAPFALTTYMSSSCK